MGEVRRYLRQRGVTGPEADRILEACRRRGVVDDRACAQLWADHWGRQGYAAAAIRAKLAAKALPAPAIDDALQAALSGDEEARARQVAADYLARAHAARPAGSRLINRLARRLSARGFDPDVIARILPDAHAER